MTKIVIHAIVFTLFVGAASADAAVVLSPERAQATPLLVTGESVDKTPTVHATDDQQVDVIDSTLATYAALLPAPSDWVLLISGFVIIGFAMRSRKRERVNFN